MQCTDRFYPSIKDFRDSFYRDRDRIIHSSSFRRLEYKTQVFINYVGDYFRTRLTHSLEVAQISRTIARELGLSEPLAEAIALAHDLGHTPFGHVGGDELDRLIKDRFSANGFEHNFQSFRVVTKLEKRYKDFDGLNLTFATLEGILKHSYPYKKPFLSKWYDEVFKLDRHPSLEAMIVDKADEIAYISADIDDGIKYGLISFATIEENELVQEVILEAQTEGYKKEEKLFRYRFTSLLIAKMVISLINESKKYIPKSDNVLCATILASEPLPIRYPDALATQIKKLKKILYEKLYRHPQILRKMYAGKQCIEGLFKALTEEPRLMPDEYYQRAQKEKIYRVAADFIAGMSDRYAMNIYHEIYGIKL
ncbi:deoxyguanosinetriphosphate triphosphohydrolase [Nitratiruptor tergarcus]|uniref:Deoxyguanosinetriphosphate triphosphohydrolase-like protein n=1 Tax=Nitratiruptor tergarcus DSM 16512 TaxID=1069081 RepID=A0A1W1WQT8_9BACT|nr:deoxyguanosinetriphosphate triphosphohydrolase [Nitratiruptor tergarcus]SMC08674.1 dGTPase [Nitratiruptor tergarcus DSM 16512]